MDFFIVHKSPLPLLLFSSTLSLTPKVFSKLHHLTTTTTTTDDDYDLNNTSTPSDKPATNQQATNDNMLSPSNPNTSNNTTASASTSSRPVYHRPYSKPPSHITSTTLTSPMTPTGAAYQAAYAHSPTVDPIGALRMQRACSLDTERRLYANHQQAARQDSTCCLKTKKKEEKRERTVRFVDSSPIGKGV